MMRDVQPPRGPNAGEMEPVVRPAHPMAARRPPSTPPRPSSPVSWSGQRARAGGRDPVGGSHVPDRVVRLDAAAGAALPEPGSGKTRALEVIGSMVRHPMHAVNCTRRRCSGPSRTWSNSTHDPLRRDRHDLRAEGQGQRGDPRDSSTLGTGGPAWRTGGVGLGSVQRVVEFPPSLRWPSLASTMSPTRSPRGRSWYGCAAVALGSRRAVPAAPSRAAGVDDR